MGTWMKRHRTKYVFNHEVEGMDHVLEGVLCGNQPDPQKRQMIEAICQKGQDQHPSSDVRAVLNLAINWALQGHSELQVSSGFKLFSSWAQHHVAALENVLTRDLLANLLTKPSRNQANLPLLLTQVFTLLHQHGNAKLFHQLLKVVDAKAPAFVQETPDLACLKNLLEMLAALQESLPRGDLAGRLASPILHALASNPIPESPRLVPQFIRDVSTVADILQQTWGQAGPGSLLNDCLKEMLRILSSVDTPDPSPCLGALAGLFPAEVVHGGIRTLVGDSRLTDAAVNCALRRLLDWLLWPTCRMVDMWVISLLKELAASGKVSILVAVTESKVEQVMDKVRYAAVREASFNILSHMLLSCQHSSLPFHQILPMVPGLLEVFGQEGGDSGQTWRTRLGKLVHYLVCLHTGFPDLYDPVLDLIKDIPCPSTEEISQRLAESRWSVQQCSGGQVEGTTDLGGKKSDTGKVGLANLGNTCYMNSVLQTLFMCDEFRRQAVLRCPAPEEKLLSELQHVFATLLLSQRPACKPREFLEASRPSWFIRGQQQDCSEFLKYLLDQIHEQQLRSINRQIEEKEVTFKNKTNNGSSSSPTKANSSPASKCLSPKKSTISQLPESVADLNLNTDIPLHDSTLVRQAFGFKVQSTFRCLACQQESQRVEDFLDIPLAFPEMGSAAVSSPVSQKTLVGGGSRLPQGGALKQESATVVDAEVKTPPLPCVQEAAVQEPEPDGKVTHLSQLLGHYLTAEPLVGDNQYRCDRCSELQDGERTICLLESPQYLILILLRFAFDTKRQIRSKVFREVTCPRTLAVPVAPSSNADQKKASASPAEAKRYSRLLQHLRPKLSSGGVASPDNFQLYGLCSVIVHSGPSSECGHYYSYARHSQPRDVDAVLDSLDKIPRLSVTNGNKLTELEADFLEDNWCLFNDERVSRATYTSFSKLTQRYPSDTPYMLVYKKLSLDSQKASTSSDTLIRQDICDVIKQDNSAFVKEQEEAAKSQTGSGRNRSPSTCSVTLDSWQEDHNQDQGSKTSEGERPDRGLRKQDDSSVAKYVF